MLSDDRLPTITADAADLARLEFATHHGSYPYADTTVVFTTPSGPAALEALLLAALAEVRRVTTPTPNLDTAEAETTRLEVGERAAAGSPLPEGIKGGEAA